MIESARNTLPSPFRAYSIIEVMSGGGVSRVWADELGGAGVTRRVVTLGSPDHGTRAARFAAAFGPDVCPMACRQLVPSSDLACDARGDAPDGPAWTAVWTAQDQVVTPPESARLDGAVNVKVQDVCSDTRIGPGDPTQCADLRDSGASSIGQPNPSRSASR
jgi:triacylglycerol lipase